jgi:two-component system sensor histidine kinase KdpD
MTWPRIRSLARPLALIGAALVASTAAVAGLESVVGIPNASATYLVAVVIVAVAAGTPAAVATALGAFLVYDVLFVEPLHALAVADPVELLNLLLVLFAGVVVGRLAGSQRERAAAAMRREHEVRALFAIQRTLAGAPSAEAALPDIHRTLATETRFDRLAIALGDGPGQERIVTDTDPREPFSEGAVNAVLQRRPGASAPDWVLVHTGQGGARRRRSTVPHRVPIETPTTRLGAIRALRDPEAGATTTEETRLLASAADQIAQALERDRLAAEATTAEVARRSDELKSALVDSVSHELRTPLAAIRATAGTLADPDVSWPPGEVRAAGAVVDREAERLARLVGNLLDLGRIEGGALRPAVAPFVLSDLVADAIGRASWIVGDRAIEVAIPDDLPAVQVDAVYVDLVVANILENAARYTQPDAPIRIRAATVAERGQVRMTLEDGGAGVPDSALGNLFQKFYRVPRPNEAARRGTGIGLTIVRGLVEAMGGTVTARRSELGGLALDVDLPIAAPLATAGDGPLDATA